MITVDGEPVSPDAQDDDGEDGFRRELHAIQLEIKLCKALLMLDPPQELSGPMHARMASNMRKLRAYRATDPSARQPADLSDTELHEASGLIRAIRALPGWSHHDSSGLRGALGNYALDIVCETDKRAERNQQP